MSLFLSDRKQRARLDGKFSESVNGVSGVLPGSVLELLLLLLYTSELFHTVGKHMVGCADVTTIIPRPLSRPQVIESR